MVNGQWSMGNGKKTVFLGEKPHGLIWINNLLCKMFLQLNHQKLDLYKISLSFVKECYRVTKSFPDDEKFGMTSQMRRAALSVHLNISEGCSRKSLTERKRFFLVSRGSLVEVDAALDVASELDFTSKNQIQLLGEKMLSCFKILSKMLESH